MINSLISEAVKFYEVNQFTKALRLLSAAEVFVEDDGAIESQNLYAQVENFKGNCLLANGDINSAQTSFQKAIGLNPLFAPAYFSLGSIFWEQGLKNDALLNFNTALSLNPKDQTIILSYGKILIDIGEIEKARQLFKKYLESNPNDLLVIDKLLSISNLTKKKNENIDTKLIIVTGLHGAGKTTFAQSLGFPVIHFDDLYDYTTKNFNYSLLSKQIDYLLFLSNHKKDFIVLDAYIFSLDEDLKLLKQVVAPIEDIAVKFVYTSPEELYRSQRSTHERRERMVQRPLNKDEDIRWSNKHQHFIKVWTDDLLLSKNITGIEYIYREGDFYSKNDEDHFLKTIGNEEYWNAKPWEIESFVSAMEGVQQYQTIEVNNQIIRPGSEKCWMSWENISKLNVDWKNKSVCDLGCYFGYFSLQFLKSGARNVAGIDRKEYFLKMYKEILKLNGFQNFKTKCILLGNGNFLPNEEFDIIVALNMLHHVQRNTSPEYYSEVLESIFRNTKEALFEINDNQIEQIKEVANKFNFKLGGEVQSHRNTMFGQRFILHFTKDKERI